MQHNAPLHIDTSSGSGSYASRSLPRLQPSHLSPLQPPPDIRVTPIRRTNTVELENAITQRERLSASYGHAMQRILTNIQMRSSVPNPFDQFRTGLVEPDERRVYSPISIVPVPTLPGFRKDAGSAPELEDETEVVDPAATKTHALIVLVAGLITVFQNMGNNHDLMDQSFAPAVASDPPPRSPVMRSPSSPLARMRSREDRARRPEGPRGSLLSQCITVLASLVADDCRVMSVPPTPKHPPYTLQAYTLDFATGIARTQANNPSALIDIGLALLPAFTTFPSVLLRRILSVYEYDLLRPTLERLRAIRVAPTVADHLRDAVPADGSGVISIHVNEPGDIRPNQPHPNGRWTPWTTPVQTARDGLISSNAPRQQTLIYRLGSLIGPLIAALFTVKSLPAAFVPIPTRPGLPLPDLAHQVCRVLDLIVECKPDAYMDILEVLAFPNTAQTRPFAAGVLSAYWPKALGHIFLSAPLPELDFSVVWPHKNALRSHQLAHEFMIWRFTPDAQDAPHGDCDVCRQVVRGTGLLCPFCMCCVHLSCYRDANGMWSPSTAMGDRSITDTPSRESPLLLYSLVKPARAGKNTVVSFAAHRFHLINLFTLTLCGICHEPLWGIRMQAFLCLDCRLPIHRSHHSASWAMLRSTFLEHFRPMLFSERDLDQQSYEELSIIYSILHTQLQILGLGLAHFTVGVEAQAPGAEAEAPRDFELHYVVRLYQAHLGSQLYRLSPQIKGYLAPKTFVPDHMLLYNFSLLAYITSLVKTAMDVQDDAEPSSSQRMLGAGTNEQDDFVDGSPVFEVVNFAHLRDVLGYDINVASDRAAVELLQHMSCLGFFTREDAEPVLDEPLDRLKVLRTTFPLPIALDLHNDHVETLVSAIEACLEDVSISMNEIGFLLLARRCWPSSQHTDYALSRLSRVVLRWIVSEEQRLLVVQRDYRRNTGSYITLQDVGIPSSTGHYPWPRPRDLDDDRHYQAGNQYQYYRRILRDRYACRWLQALHSQDSNFYAVTLFSHATDLAAELDTTDVHLSAEDTVMRADRVLKLITRFRDANILFSAFDDIMLRWLDAITPLCMSHKGAIVFRSLKGICHPGPESSSAVEKSADPKAHVVSIDLWRVVDEYAEKGGDDLLQGLQWMRVMAQSGVDIPTLTFKRLAGPLAQAMTLVEAIVAVVWLKPSDRHDLHRLLEQMHDRYSDSICSDFRTMEDPQTLFPFIRHTLAVMLLLRGCERDKVTAGGLLESAETHSLGTITRLQPNARPEQREELDPDFIANLVRYVSEGPDSVALHVATFLNLLLSHPGVMTPEERSSMVIVNGHILSTCAWQLYDIQLHALSVMRMHILLHVLVVDAQPMENILTDIFCSSQWERRFQALTRLFRVIMDITHPEFYLAGLKWQAAVAPLYQLFFEALWQDDRETIRLAVDTWLKTLLPAHFDGISTCWNEYFLTSDYSDRLRLASFLSQLQPHFPHWQTLKWETIVGVMPPRPSRQAVDDVEIEEATSALHLPRYGYPSTTSAPDAVDQRLVTQLRVTLLTVALSMIANGVNIGIRQLLELKLRLVCEFGMGDPTLDALPTGTERHVRFSLLTRLPRETYPCITPLLKMMDAVVYLKYPLSALGVDGEQDVIVRELVGQLFVDVVLRVVNSSDDGHDPQDRLRDDLSHARPAPYTVQQQHPANNIQRSGANSLPVSKFQLASLPYTVLRSLIECVIVIINKHEVETKKGVTQFRNELRSAVRKISALATRTTSYDIRYLALMTSLVFVKRHRELSRSIVGPLTETVMEMLASLKGNNDNLLVIQARTFLKAVFQRFPDGVFWHLAKKPLTSDHFETLKQILEDNTRVQVAVEDDIVIHASFKDSLLRSTLRHGLRAMDDPALTTILQNLSAFVDQVHHADYEPETLQGVGIAINSFVKAEWTPLFNPSGLLSMTSCIIIHNQASSRDLATHFDALLRKSLANYIVSADALSKVIRLAHTHRASSTTMIPTAILDVLSDAENARHRMDIGTLGSLSEVFSSQSFRRQDRPLFEASQVVEAANYVMLTVCLLPVPDNFQLPVLHSYLKAMELVLHAAAHDVNFLAHVVTGHRMRLRTWNLLVLQALQRPTSGAAAQLFDHIQAFSMCLEGELSAALSAFSADADQGTSATLAGDVGHAAVSIKLWLLLAQLRAQPQSDTQLVEDNPMESMAEMYDRSTPSQTRPSHSYYSADPGHSAPLRPEDETNVAEWKVWSELFGSYEKFSRFLVPSGSAVARGSLGELAWQELLGIISFARTAGCALVPETHAFQSLLSDIETVAFDSNANPKLRKEAVSFRDAPARQPFSSLVAQSRDQVFVAETAYLMANRYANATAGGKRRMAAATVI
ncbi:hypothetical protein BKA62DRAFT_694808 [Auriculariales sp. MPI-PUGE-AT-0066]|nr:hypothetical protein BKA62DRAFT_694808 [Auriculariales sp. MPI-PUGE-AT-0066]